MIFVDMRHQENASRSSMFWDDEDPHTVLELPEEKEDLILFHVVDGL